MLNAFANSRFNSQPHKGADATDKTTITMSDKSFSSQPHKGADVNCGGYRGDKYVSTHSPTRGLTPSDFRSTTRMECFNSQPHKGADDKKDRRILYS